MLNIWGRISSINVRKVVLCAQMLGLRFQRVDAGLQYGVVNTPVPLVCWIYPCLERHLPP